MNSNSFIPVIYSSDDNYIPYLYCSIKSLIDYTATENHYRIYILNTEISEENKQQILTLRQNNIDILFVDVTKVVADYSKDIFSLSYHFTIETYYRFFLSELFSDLDKVLYMDGDTIVQKDISELFSIDIGDNYLGVTHDCEIVRATNVLGSEYSDYFEKILGVDINSYFQAGVMIINLNKWRKDNIQQKLINRLLEVKTPKYVDQDILNSVCKGKIKFIPQNWNYNWHIPFIDDDYYENIGAPLNNNYESAKNNPYIIHFTGDNYKPINYPTRQDALIFWKYAAQSPYFDFFLKNLITALMKKNAKILALQKKIKIYQLLQKITFGKISKRFHKKSDKKKRQLRRLMSN